MNKSMIEESSKFTAQKVFNTFIFDLPAKLSHITDVSVLNEVKRLAEFQNKPEILKLVLARASDININLS